MTDGNERDLRGGSLETAKEARAIGAGRMTSTFADKEGAEEDANVPKFILRTFDRRRTPKTKVVKPSRFLKRYTTTAPETSSAVLCAPASAGATPFSERGVTAHETAEFLRLHYPDDRKNLIASKIESVKKAGFNRPASVSRTRAFHSSIEYKPEILADKARILRTLNRKELKSGSGKEGIYGSMRKVSGMVAVSKQLTEDIGTMDHELRARLNAMFYGGDRRDVVLEKCFQPTRAPKQRLKGKTDHTNTASTSAASTRRGGPGVGRQRPSAGTSISRQASWGAGTASGMGKSTETKGSGFRKKRSQNPPPRWIDHTRLLQRAQLMADMEWNTYLLRKNRGISFGAGV